MKVKTILVSQPEPKVENSPYFDLINRQKVKIDFRSFIHVEGVSSKDVRAQKVDLSKFTAIIGAKYNPLMVESKTTTLALSAAATCVTTEAYCFALKVFKESLETETTFSAP